MITEEQLKIAMDYIINQTKWAKVFPDQCLDRIRQLCIAIKETRQLPFNKNV